MNMFNFLLLVSGSIIIFILYRKYCENNDMDLSPSVLLRLMIIPVFFCLCLLFWQLTAASTSFSKPFQTHLFEIIHMAWRAFTLNVSFSDISDLEASLDLHPSLASHLFTGFLMLAAPLLTLSAALSFFTIPAFLLKFYLFRGRQVLIFSSLNEKAVRYGEAMQKNRSGKRAIIVFLNENEEIPDVSLSRLNAVILRSDITRLHFITASSLKRIRFLLTDSDDYRNIAAAEALEKKYAGKAHMTIFSDNRLNRFRLDQINREIPKGQPGPDDLYFLANGTIVQSDKAKAEQLRSGLVEVREETCGLLYKELFLHSFLDEELLLKMKEADSHVLHCAVYGCGRIAVELAGILLWYCQLPDIRVEVDVITDDASTPERILENCPDFAEALRQVSASDTVPATLRILETPDESVFYHAIFVCTDDDDTNFRTALNLRRTMLRREASQGCAKLYALVRNDTMREVLDQVKDQSIYGCDDSVYMDYSLKTQMAGRFNRLCPIIFFGSLFDDLACLEQLQFDALRIHSHYYGNPDEKLLPAKDQTIRIPSAHYLDFFNGPQSNRRSSLALACAVPPKAAWAAVHADEDVIARLAEAEHVRWCIFTLLEGFYPVPSGREGEYFNPEKTPKSRDADPLRGYHAVLRPWADLQTRSHLSPGWKDAANANVHLVSLALKMASASVSDRL
ncbi:MAG: hypothetical protein IKD69_05900 [Solobacterium sp.]|nr:hypothetical protein [Solobacterium sp.]